VKLCPTIIIDTREQDPLTFRNLPTEPGTLAVGDYSIKGLEHLIAVERKRLEDLLACVGRERERFERELSRMRAYRYRHLVVETDSKTLLSGRWQRSKVTAAAACGSLAAWAARYGVCVWFAGDHEQAGLWVERILFQAARDVAKRLEACQAFAKV